ncbi:hypothetical protein J32TS6_38870 [Virgibacillus pantothenticus]|nr:hypothetical protein J32TS6_38870 [Virgibacillus pantothenticus]
MLGAEAGRGYSVIPYPKATNFMLSYLFKKTADTYLHIPKKIKDDAIKMYQQYLD